MKSKMKRIKIFLTKIPIKKSLIVLIVNNKNVKPILYKTLKKILISNEKKEFNIILKIKKYFSKEIPTSTKVNS